MRQSDLKLTMKTYMDAAQLQGPVLKAVSALPWRSSSLVGLTGKTASVCLTAKQEAEGANFSALRAHPNFTGRGGSIPSRSKEIPWSRADRHAGTRNGHLNFVISRLCITAWLVVQAILGV